MKSLAFGCGLSFIVIVVATISTLASWVILLSRDDQDSPTTVSSPPSSLMTTDSMITTQTTENSTIISSTETTTTTSTTTANTNTPNDTCMYPPFTNPQTKIVGGMAAITPIPWQAFVVVDNMYSCGGTILDDLTVLCAAHCFPNLDSPSTIRVGSLMRWNGGQVTNSYHFCKNKYINMDVKLKSSLG